MQNDKSIKTSPSVGPEYLKAVFKIFQLFPLNKNNCKSALQTRMRALNQFEMKMLEKANESRTLFMKNW